MKDRLVIAWKLFSGAAVIFGVFVEVRSLHPSFGLLASAGFASDSPWRLLGMSPDDFAHALMVPWVLIEMTLIGRWFATLDHWKSVLVWMLVGGVPLATGASDEALSWVLSAAFVAVPMVAVGRRITRWLPRVSLLDRAADPLPRPSAGAVST